jgi:hypothetical protein
VGGEVAAQEQRERTEKVLVRPPRHIEFAHIGATPRKAKLAPGLHDVPVEIKLLHPVVAAVGNVEAIVRPDREAAWIIKVAFLRRRLAAPARNEVSRLVELLYGIAITSCDSRLSPFEVTTVTT